jgi:hypothetical protein
MYLMSGCHADWGYNTTENGLWQGFEGFSFLSTIDKSNKDRLVPQLGPPAQHLLSLLSLCNNTVSDSQG